MKISIVTIAFNAESTIVDAVSSVLSQKIGPHELEYIVVDGASTDQTLQRLEPFRSGIAQLISEPDQGLYDAMNKGIAASTGEFVGILNADDFYPHDGVLLQVCQLLQASQADSLYGDLKYVDGTETNRVVRNWISGPFEWKSFYNGWMPPHPTFFLRKTAYEKHGSFDLRLKSAADYELMLRMLFCHRISTIYLNEVLVHMRTGGVSNASWSHRWKANREDRLAWRLNGLQPRPWTLALKPLRKVLQWFP